MTKETDAVHIQLARQVGGAIACLLALALLLGLTACGGGQAKQPDNEPPAAAAESGPEDLVQPDEPPVDLESEVLPPADEEEHDGFPEPEEDDDPLPAISYEFTQEEYDKVVSDVLDAIIKDNMTPLEQCRAVFDYVHNNIRYIGSSDKSDWISGAYVGLTTQKGDCFTYYAVSRALLTALEIDNLEVQREGGTSQHFWNLVNCGDGWYHFDTCPRNLKMPSFTSFMVTDEQIAAFTAMAGRHYYDFDGSLLPERATEIVTNTRPIPRPVEPEEEETEDPDAENPDVENPDADNPDAENPDPENPDAVFDEPQLPPDDLTDDPDAAAPSEQTDPGTEPEDGGPADVWTEPAAEEWPEPALGDEETTEPTVADTASETEAG